MDRIVELHTRFLLPVAFERDRKDEVLASLLSRQLAGSSIWSCEEDVPDEYLDNTLPYLRPAMFCRSRSPSGKYLRVSSPLILECCSELRVGVSEQVELPAELDSPGIEFFLTSYGVGVLSVSLRSSRKLSFAEARLFNSALHYGRAWRDSRRCARLTVGDRSRDAWSRAGWSASSTLPELIEALWPPLAKADQSGELLRTLQRSMGVHCVARLPPEFDLADRATRERLAPELAALQGVWRPTHAGIDSSDQLENHCLLNRRHWLAAGGQGVAHLVVDQPPESDPEAVDFNPRRLALANSKHFFQFLTALVQQLALHGFNASAASIHLERAGSQITDDAFSSLRRELLDFSLAAQPSQISREDNSTRVYQLFLDVLGVAQSWERLRRVLSDLDASRRDQEHLNLGVNTANSSAATLRIQNKIEWVEVFVVSVYAVELAHQLGHAFGLTAEHRVLPWWYPGVPLLAIAVLTPLCAALALDLFHGHSPENASKHPAPTRSAPPAGSKRVRKILWIALACALVLGHLALGAIVGHHKPTPTSDRESPTAHSK